MLTKEQILEFLRENPNFLLPEGATEEEIGWFEEALVELGLDGDDEDDLDDDDDWDLDDDDLDSDDEDDDEDWEDEEL